MIGNEQYQYSRNVFENAESQADEARRLAREASQNIKKLEKATPQAGRLLSSAGERLSRNRLLKALLFAGATHTAAFHGDDISRYIKEKISQIESWDGRVIDYQSEEEAKKTKNVIAERMTRKDDVEISRFKEEARKKMEKGESPSMEDVQFALEEKNGVSHDQVELARAKAHQKMDQWRGRFLDGLDTNDLKEFVADMYGQNSDYEAGQGSVSTYFNTGKRNCNAVAKGQLIVLDNIVKTLSEEQQKRIRLGQQYVQQHVYATLSMIGTDGNVQKTYLLEPGIREVEGDLGTAGTATVSVDQLKRAMVAEKPVTIDAKKGENIEKGPMLNFVSNQPVMDNIVVDGPLKPSVTYMMAIGERIPKDVEKLTDTNAQLTKGEAMELTLDENLPEMTVADVAELKAEAKTRGYSTLTIWEGKKLTPEIVRAINDVPSGAEPMARIEYHDIRDQSKEAVEAMLKSSSHIVFFRADARGNAPPQLIESLYIADGFQGVLEIEVPSRQKVLGDHMYETRELANEDFKKIFKEHGDPAVPEIRIIGNEILHNPARLEMVLKSGFKRVVLDDLPANGAEEIAEEKAMLQKLVASDKTFVLTAYNRYLDQYPDLILDAKNIVSIQEDGDWALAVGSEMQIGELKSIATEWNNIASHKRFVPKLHRKIGEMEKRLAKLPNEPA